MMLHFLASERDTLYTEYKFAMYIYIYGDTYVTTFSSVGNLLCKGGEVRPQPFFKSAAWAELSIYHWIRYEH